VTRSDHVEGLTYGLGEGIEIFIIEYVWGDVDCIQLAQDCDWGLLYCNMLQVPLQSMVFLEQL
jgi:hypothetical protein